MLKRLVLSHADDPRFEHRVISLRGMGSVGPELQAAGVRVEALGLDKPLHLPGRFLKLIRAIRRDKPDVVQTWMYHADLIGGLAARFAGVKRIIWNVRIAQIAPGYGIARATGWIMRACAALSGTVPARIVYVAESARVAHEAAGYDTGKSVLIRNGYVIRPLPDRSGDLDRLRAELGVGPACILIGSAGRYNPQKNHRSFIAACAAIAPRHPDAHFVMFGSGVEIGDPDLSRWIAASGCPERFRLLGERRDLAELLPHLDLFCLHSLSEGFPNVVAEAMAAAVPCVVTDTGDAAMLVESTGWVVPAADDKALADRLHAALSLDAQVRKDYGRLARHRIESEFSMPVITGAYENLYRTVVASVPGPLRADD